MERVVSGLNFPTSLTSAPDGTLYLAESGLPFGGAPAGGTVSRIDAAGRKHVLASGLGQPLNGLLWHQGALIIADGGYPGRILRLDLDDPSYPTRVLVDNLPGFGNYQTSMVAAGPDGRLYFGQGAMTNSGVIGADSHDLAWLKAVEHEADVPGYTVELTGHVVHTEGPGGERKSTGGFAKFGTFHPAGTRLSGKTPCTAAVLRCEADGSQLEVFAWGLRNVYGLAFLPDGRLLATEQGADARGVRPVYNCPDFLYEVKRGAYYGWPDFFGGLPIHSESYRGPDGKVEPFLLQNHAELPPPEEPLVVFDINACPTKFAEVPSGHRFAGDLVVAQFGDEKPMTGPAGPPVGRNLVRVSLKERRVCALPKLPLKRPIDVAFVPGQPFFYVVDFGDFEITPQKGISARAETGCLWKVPISVLEAL